MNKSPFRLFARPSFLESVARLVDPGRALNKCNSSESGKTADYYAILSDWEQVGIDMMKAVKEFKKELASQPQIEE